MSEPSERDREMARDAIERGLDEVPEGCDPDDDPDFDLLVDVIAAARAEGDQAGYECGRREERVRWTGALHNAAGISDDEPHDAAFSVTRKISAAYDNGKTWGRREAIEECAKIVEAAGLMRSAKAIRALAEPAPQQASQPQEQSA